MNISPSSPPPALDPDRPYPVGHRVHIYRNLHAEREFATGHTYSVRLSGTVVMTQRCVLLGDVALRVQPAGRGRVIAEGRKNVHAYLSGQLLAYGCEAIDKSAPWLHRSAGVTYNPYRHTSFVLRDSEAPVHRAALAMATPEGVYLLDPLPPGAILHPAS